MIGCGAATGTGDTLTGAVTCAAFLFASDHATLEPRPSTASAPSARAPRLPKLEPLGGDAAFGACGASAAATPKCGALGRPTTRSPDSVNTALARVPESEGFAAECEIVEPSRNSKASDEERMGWSLSG